MNVAQHVERTARWFPDQPAIVFEDAPLTELSKSATGKILERVLRAP